MRYLICLMTCLLPLASPATTVISLSVEKMAQEADLIVRGVVTQRDSNWNKDRNRIYTVTTIRVEERIKGSSKPAGTITLRQIGGEVDGIAQTVVGNAPFVVGEEVLLFLEKHPTENLHFVMGMAQGKYSIDRSVTPATVRRAMGDLKRVPTPQIGSVVQLQTPIIRTLAPSLNALVARIRGALTPR